MFRLSVRPCHGDRCNMFLHQHVISRAIKPYKCRLLLRWRRIVQSGDTTAVRSMRCSRDIWVYFCVQKVFLSSIQKLDERNTISFSLLRHLGIFLVLKVSEVAVGQQVSGSLVPEQLLLVHLNQSSPLSLVQLQWGLPLIGWIGC